MQRHRRRIVIVGAGHAGGVAALALRQAGFDGDITLVGQEAWPPYERPPLSKDVLAGRMEVERTFLRAATDYAASGIELILGTAAQRIDRTLSRVLLADGRELAYDALLLATGGRCRRLACPGADHPRLHYLRDLDHCLKLRGQLTPQARVVVIGAGLIGLEVAATAREMGCAITVIEQAARPLARVLPPQIGDIFAALHRDKGVDLHTEARVTAIGERDGHAAVDTDSAGRIDADLAVVGIGIVPDTALAEAAGLEVSDGIVTDEFGRTSDPSIFAVGDVARSFDVRLGRHRRQETWQNAQNQAVAVARILAGSDAPYADVPWFWTDQYGLNFQSVGCSERSEKLIWRGQPGKAPASAFHMEGDRIVGASCFNPGRDMRHIKRIVAERAAIDAGALADVNVPLSALCRKE